MEKISLASTTMQYHYSQNGYVWLGTQLKRHEYGQSRHRVRLAKSRRLLGEETNLHQLFNFIVDVIKFSFIVSTEDDTGRLIDGAIHVALHARYADEIRDSVRVLDAIVIYSTIPSEKLRECIKGTLLYTLHHT